MGGRGGSAAEIILGFFGPKSCACWADQGPREERCYPVAVTQTRAFHLTGLAGPGDLRASGDSAFGSCDQKPLNNHG